MKRSRFLSYAFLAFGCLSAAAVENPASAEAFFGQWALTMNNGDAGWMPIERVDGVWSAQLWTVGSPKPVNDIAFAEGRLTFVRQCKIGEPEFVGGPPTGQSVACDFVVTVDGDAIRMVMKGPNGVTQTHTGKRLPPMPSKPDLSAIRFGEPVTLFNGVDLTGWRLMNPQQINGWKVVDGVLENESPKKSFDPFSQYGNLRTNGVFGDGKLTLEFNVPAGGNSGVYVRGAYEAQVVDRDSKMQGIQGPGAIFSRIVPSKNVGKVGGEWQRYEITIVDRHATVVLNGEKVIDNEPVIGNTNGAFQADITQPGPHHLQGDHTAVKYRNIVWRPVIQKE